MSTHGKHLINGLQNALDYLNGDTTKAREVSVTVPEPAAPHKVKVISRGFDAMPEDAKEQLLTTLDNTVEIYKKAKEVK